MSKAGARYARAMLRSVHQETQWDQEEEIRCDGGSKDVESNPDLQERIAPERRFRES